MQNFVSMIAYNLLTPVRFYVLLTLDDSVLHCVIFVGFPVNQRTRKGFWIFLRLLSTRIVDSLSTVPGSVSDSLQDRIFFRGRTYQTLVKSPRLGRFYAIVVH